jgi:hypothetical protein
MKKIILVLLAVLLVTSPSYANDTPGWLTQAIKVKDPNQLSYFATASKACPLNDADLENIVEGVFVRSRIKPLSGPGFLTAPVYFDLGVSCVTLENANPVFNIQVHFSRYRPHPAIKYDFDFGTTGIGGKDFIKQSVKECVENAVTEFIKANFDL